VWYAPGGRRVGSPLQKARRYDVATFVASPAGLPKGRWRCSLRAGRAVVYEVGFRIA